ncbi:probable sugar phosphate/phosphate translocator At1g06470 [Macadamia integrifolia]|uniref:probable sugar phosphate/phosphate translocator At1g06470 n=1 Tax=Macadamia integrifolia TaxID=60698 RepID=UPI001C5307E2|nr:probable sugar phosphate/phosphate translocator At1g06470 [Macadamia integrifolia]XP_042477884.1 probable sugar phosphate/phosphate translocator At1g06470 [Macadamia integrifolia]XP_042477885.1 probable sugar phosphate/phosphate translocator At1g06470 [Macadamia integrifolia]XP_042477886.1 probable sugar phosphate/phosphate translocator At1g06470 [Macadamia integrifolia]XP_042477887.1 probable sugar phosphate/phosphate translocator At1g06470 [Macadamia integrifolia]XP_042477888.1 probable s
MQKEIVETDLETEKAASAGVSDIQGGSQGFRREPSFSGWCDENGIIYSTCSSDKADASIEDPDFELPLPEGDGPDNEFLGGVRQKFTKFQQRSMHLNGGHSINSTVSYMERNGNETNSVPCNIENGSESQQNGSHFNVDGAATRGTHKTVADTQSSISIVIVLKTLFFVFVWYGFSTCLTLYNKTLLGDNLGKFPAPMLMNTVHFAMQAVLSNAITWFWDKRFQPRVAMSWRDYFIRVVPTALGTALDINLSNASLVFITVTFATMCKSASPIFLLLFAFAFRLETPSIKLLGIILIISVGILLTVAKETEFDFWGFIFIMLAAIMSGFRWSMTQILLQREVYGLKNPLTLMSYVAPVMAVATALLSLMMDPWDEFKKNEYFNNSWHVFRSTLLMLFGGTLAFFMVLTEYILVSVTSAVTVTIAGVVKEAVTILVAVFYFHDQFTWLKGNGLVIIMVGVGLFNWYKYQNLQKHQESEDNEAGFVSTNVAAKYVILEEMEDQVDDA